MADTDLAAGQDNQDGEARPDWLPENFNDPQSLVDSYKEAQRKITEEATARAQEATARRNLEELVAQQQAALEQIQQAQQQPAEDPNEWYAAFEQDPIATQRALAEQAAAAAVQQFAAQQQQATQPFQASQAEIVASLAYRQLEDTRGQITPELRTEMANLATEFPHLIPEDAAQSPQRLAASLGILADLAERRLGPQEQMSNEDIMRTMKVNAQSATGAGGRPSPEDAHVARWKEIVNAPTGTLGL